MTVRSDHIAKQFGLGRIEVAYLDRADAALGWTWRWRRREAALDELAEMLSERPPAAAIEELCEEVGDPVEAAADALAAAEIAAGPGPVARWQGLDRRWKWIQVCAILALVLGVGWLYRYFTVEPHIFNPCGGGQASEQIDREAAGSRERVVTFRRGERVSAFLCPLTQDEGVEILDVRFPSGAGGMPLQPVGAETWTRTLTAVGRAGPIDPYVPTADLQTQVYVWFEMEHCYMGDGRMSWSHIVVEYRYRWRTRTVDIPLHESLSVTTGCDAGTLPSDIEAEYDGWQNVINEAEAWHLLTDVTYEPFHLTADNISRDLCRYLRGVIPIDRYTQIEPLEDRAVFRLDDERLAVLLIDGAVNGICPEFADQRDELVALALGQAAKN